MSSRAPDELPVWPRVCTTLRRRIGERNFATWIAPLRSTWVQEGLALEARDAATRDRVARHFLAEIEAALCETIGRVGRVRLAVASAPPALPVRLRVPNPDHTFESFVLGETNRHACSAARRVIGHTAPGPLFLYGPSGVGKTHLIHAIHHAFDEPGALVGCLSAAELVAALVSAYEERADGRFWSNLSPLRALLLDDVHSVKGLDEIQERLMAGLEGWLEAGRLLVLTSDRAPEDTPILVARLRARFANGVVASIAPPEPALRLAILRHKAQAHGVTLDGPLAARLAAAVGGSVRRLEGALTRLLAHARLSGRPVDEALALEVLPELRARPAEALSVEQVLAVTAAAFGTTARRLRGRSTSADLVLARQVAMYLARTLLGRPFGELAGPFARDHTTVLHAWRSVAARRDRDAMFSATVERIARQLRRGEEEP